MDLKEERRRPRPHLRAAPQGLGYQEAFSASQLYYTGSAYQGLRRLLEQRGRLRDGKVILIAREVPSEAVWFRPWP